MTAGWDTQAVIRALNVLGALIVFGVVIGAYTVQFVDQEAPCPLCLLIRLGMLAVGFGFLLNARFGPRPAHYGFILLSALFGAAVAIRQILLHIVPGTGSYGDAVLGLHLYTWAFLVFSTVIFAVAVAMFFSRQFERSPLASPALVVHATTVLFAIGFLLALLNVVTTTIECGVGFCPDNPQPGAFG